MPYKLTWLTTVLKNAGLKVAPQPGWMNRGHGNMGTVKGVMCHHTVGPLKGNMPSLKVLISGRPGLSGPLAQLGLGRDGTYYIVAAGRCYHAGQGKWKKKSTGEIITTGNSSFIGIEAENTGIGNSNDPRYDPWPAVQLDAYRRGVAAILKHIGQTEEMCCGHKEWRPKIDPHTIDMGDFRKEVAAIMAGTAPPPQPIPRTDTKGRPTLRRASSTNPKSLVEEVQRKVGFTGDDVDGEFGPLTEAKVRQFQRDNGLVPDGIVGPKTWEKI
jgi:hypothetical protein